MSKGFNSVLALEYTEASAAYTVQTRIEIINEDASHPQKHCNTEGARHFGRYANYEKIHDPAKQGIGCKSTWEYSPRSGCSTLCFSGNLNEES